MKFEIILPLLCFLLDPLINKHCRAWSFMINLWIDFTTYQKQRILLLAREMSSNNLEPSKANVLGVIWRCHTASGRPDCFEFLFWFSSAILLFKKKLLFFSLWTKIWQILHVILERKKSVFLQILHQSSASSNITPLYFFSSNSTYFDQKKYKKMQILEIFECSGRKIGQFPYVSFKTAGQFVLQICTILHYHDK